MRVIICTHKRPHRQITLHNLPPIIRQRTELIIQHDQWKDYKDVHENLIVMPPGVDNLPQTREWIKNNIGGHVVMLDDDLDFGVRREDEPTKFRQPTDNDLGWMFACIESGLRAGYAHVGVSHREGANRNTEEHLKVGRMMRILAYNMDLLRTLRVQMDRLPDVEDFDVTLQLLRLGYPNLILNNWVHNQHGSNTEGGCSEYRTLETHDRDVRKLAELHPGFVKVVTKKTKGAWGGGERTDVRIQWKKAFESSGASA